MVVGIGPDSGQIFIRKATGKYCLPARPGDSLRPMIAEPLRANLLAVAKAYAKATRCSMTQVSWKFYGNAAFFSEFGRGRRSISIDKMDEMLMAFAAKWPAGTPWPSMRAVLTERPRR
jgi:hypothetical protein